MRKKDIKKLLIFTFEKVLPYLKIHKNYSEKLSFLIDMNMEEFRTEELELIEKLIEKHYP